MKPPVFEANSLRGIRKKEKEVKSVCNIQIMLIQQSAPGLIKFLCKYRDKTKVKVTFIVNHTCKLHCGFQFSEVL